MNLDEAIQFQLRQAIDVLFATCPNHDAVQRANQFLYEVNERKECFAASLHLISSEKDFRVAHFAVNLLYNKVSMTSYLTYYFT